MEKRLVVCGHFYNFATESYNEYFKIMARKSKRAELRKQEIVSSVPAEQRKMITQPIAFAFLNGDMSVMHARIMTSIMDRLQTRITKAVAKQHEGGYAGSLFNDDDFKPLEGTSGKYLPFSVKYSELGVDPANYRYISEAARAMQGSLVYEKEVDGYMRSIVVFPVVDVPDETKKERRTDIKLYMLPSTAKDLFTFTRYQKYLKDAVFQFTSGYAGRIYLLINAYKYSGVLDIEYEKLRKILLTTKDEKTGKYVADKYKDINDFKKRVLEPARKQIAEVADQIDCTFDYEFRYPAGKKRGTPEAVIFHIHLTDTGRNIKHSQLEAHDAIEARLAKKGRGSAQRVVEDAEAVEISSARGQVPGTDGSARYLSPGREMDAEDKMQKW